MAFSMAQKYSPDLLQFYVLDFGGRMLGNLREAPHCVAVAFEDEKQKSEHMIQQIRNQMELRKKVFAEKRVQYIFLLFGNNRAKTSYAAGNH